MKSGQPYYYFYLPRKSFFNHKYAVAISIGAFFLLFITGSLFLLFPLFIVFFVAIIYEQIKESDQKAAHPIESFTEVCRSTVEKKDFEKTTEANAVREDRIFYVWLTHPTSQQVIAIELFERSHARYHVESVFLYDALNIGEEVEVRLHPTNKQALCLVLYKDPEHFEHWRTTNRYRHYDD